MEAGELILKDETQVIECLRKLDNPGDLDSVASQNTAKRIAEFYLEACDGDFDSAQQLMTEDVQAKGREIGFNPMLIVGIIQILVAVYKAWRELRSRSR